MRPTLDSCLSDCGLDNWKDTSFDECPAVEWGLAVGIARRPRRRRVFPVILQVRKANTIYIHIMLLRAPLG